LFLPHAQPIREWLDEEYETGEFPSQGRKPLECTQRAGDIIFVPRWFGHGTYNLQATVGVAVEIEPGSQFISKHEMLRPWSKNRLAFFGSTSGKSTGREKVN
jgi:hypothetical protein